MTRTLRYWLVVLAFPTFPAAAVTPTDGAGPSAASTGSLTLTYLANEGFLIEAGDTKVLIDALFGDGIRNYETVPTTIRGELESASGRFTGVDLVLASHHHGDHFDAGAVRRHLRANPEARFISTRQAIERLLAVDAELASRADGHWPGEGTTVVETFTGGDLDGVTLTIFNLHHGRQRQPTQNLGLMLDIAGHRVLHVGDTEVELDDISTLGLGDLGIDIALIPTWLVVTAKHRRVTESLDAAVWVVMHMGAEGAPGGYFHPKTTRSDLIQHLTSQYPNAWVPTEVLATRSFSAASGLADRP